MNDYFFSLEISLLYELECCFGDCIKDMDIYMIAQDIAQENNM